MKIFIKNLILSFFISLTLLVILSILMSKTDMNEKYMNSFILGIVSISLLIGGFNISKAKKEKGIIFGSVLGIIYILVLYLISSIVTLNFSLSINSLIFIVLGILGGAIGGILGVNF